MKKLAYAKVPQYAAQDLWEAFRDAFPSLRTIPFRLIAGHVPAWIKIPEYDEYAIRLAALEAGFPDCQGSITRFPDGTTRLTPYVGDRHFWLTPDGRATADYTERPSAIAAEAVIDLIAKPYLQGAVSVRWEEIGE